MKKGTIAAITGASLIALGGPLVAQQQPSQPQPSQPAPPPSPQSQQVDVSEEELRTFAEIYVDIEETRAELSEDMSGAADQQEAQEIQSQMQEKALEAIEEHGWSPTQYNQVASAISNDPSLREQAMSLIAEMGAGAG